jgi:hypothetical protein
MITTEMALVTAMVTAIGVAFAAIASAAVIHATRPYGSVCYTQAGIGSSYAYDGGLRGAGALVPSLGGITGSPPSPGQGGEPGPCPPPVGVPALR